MKTTLFYFLALLSLLYGCSKQEKNTFTREYRVLLNIQDASGVEVLKSIPTVDNPHSSTNLDLGIGFTAPIIPELYTWEVVDPEVIRDAYARTPELHEITVTPAAVKDHYYLRIFESSPSLHPYVNMITHKLSCSNIFGDDSDHIIVSYWKPREDSQGKNWLLDDGTSALNYCYRMMIDGNEISVTQEPLIHYYNGLSDKEGFWDNASVAWIVINN